MKHAPIREINAEDGKAVVPPPPEILEDDPELSPEEQEEARRAYLLQRFWISGRGFWGRGGGRWAWAFTVGLFVLIVANLIIQYRINVWNRSIFDAL